MKKEQHNAFINSQGHRFLAVGGFNAKQQCWGSRLINPEGHIVLEKQLEVISTGEPPFWPTDLNKLQVY
jgi:hypothetical protein